MYDTLLPIVKDSYGQNYPCLPSFLQKLQDSVKALRTSYRNSHIQVDYSQAQIQAAYLLTYYPGHVLQMKANLALAAQNLTFRRLLMHSKLKATLLGSGPMPEAVSLGLIRKNPYTARTLRAVSYDINAHQWRSASQVTANVLSQLRPYIRYSHQANTLDLGKVHALKAAEQDLKSSHLVVVQNCVNEIYCRDYSAFGQNIAYLLDTMPGGSGLMFSDLQYGQTSHCLAILKNMAEERGDLQLVYDHSTNLKVVENIWHLPSSMRRYLLTGDNDLIPRGSVKQYSLCLLKRA
jgi:hypothetical protein